MNKNTAQRKGKSRRNSALMPTGKNDAMVDTDTTLYGHRIDSAKERKEHGKQPMGRN